MQPQKRPPTQRKISQSDFERNEQTLASNEFNDDLFGITDTTESTNSDFDEDIEYLDDLNSFDEPEY